VAGDVDPQAVRDLAEENFGTIPANADLPERVRPEEPRQLAERRVTFEDPRVAQPYVMRSYLAPERDPGAQEDAAALVFLSELLGGSGATSLMGRTLQFEEKTALYTGAFYDGVSLDETTFSLIVMPVPGRSLAEAEADMDRMIARFLEEGVDQDAFERLKTQLKADQIYRKDNLQSLARAYGEALTSGLTVEDVQAWPEVLAAVTPEDVMAAAERLFDKRRSVTGYLRRPAENGAVNDETIPTPGASAEPEEVTQ
jgi:zinc protease